VCSQDGNGWVRPVEEADDDVLDDVLGFLIRRVIDAASNEAYKGLPLFPGRKAGPCFDAAIRKISPSTP